VTNNNIFFHSDDIIIMTVVQKRLKIVRLEVKYMHGTAEYLDNETADNESVSDN